MSDKNMSDAGYSIASINISNAKVIEYNKDNPEATVLRNNEYGEYICLRISVRPYKSSPMAFMCIANNDLVSRINNMKLTPGDYVSVAGALEGYIDENNRHSTRVKLYNIDYSFRTKNKDNKEKKEEPTNSTIDLSECDIFQKKIE